MPFDPYQIPETDLSAPRQAGATLSPEALADLEGARPWLRLLSIVLAMSVGLMLLGGLSVGALSLFSSEGFEGMGALGGLGLAVLYALLGALYALPAWRLHESARGLERFRSSQDPDDLAYSLRSQRLFWRFVGMSILIIIGLYAALIAAGVLFAVLGAA